MSLSSFARIFMPKDKVFYGLFEQMTANLKKMSAVLITAMQEHNIKARDILLRQLHDLEHECDEVTHQIFIELGRNFITPFDREDIHHLASSLDDVADYMWGSAKRFTNYRFDEVDDVMYEFAVIIEKCTAALYEGVGELRNMRQIKRITDCCVNINSYENEADDLLDKATCALFSNHSMNPIDLFKRKDLYEEMEFVTDKCEDAANVIESIVIKYS